MRQRHALDALRDWHHVQRRVDVANTPGQHVDLAAPDVPPLNGLRPQIAQLVHVRVHEGKAIE